MGITRIIVNFNKEGDFEEAMQNKSFNKILTDFQLSDIAPLFNSLETRYLERYDEIMKGCGNISPYAKIMQFSYVNNKAKIVSSLQRFNEYFSFVEEDLEIHPINPIRENFEYVTNESISNALDIINYDITSTRQSGREIIVAITDTGINHKHRYLKQNLWRHPNREGCYGINFSMFNHTYDVTDTNGHGTLIAGIIASNDVDNKITGLSRNSKLLSIKINPTPLALTLSTVCKAIATAYVLGADIINCSWYINIDGAESRTLNCLLAFLKKKGCIPVFGAGNLGYNVNRVYPQKLKDIIVVGAIDNNKKRLFDSNYGKNVTIWAPGDDIKSTFKGDENAISSASGTSMSAPFVSATIALLKQKNKNLKIEDIKEALQSIPSVIIDDQQNHGYILNVKKALERIA